MSEQQQAAPGWYPAVDGPYQRYWDGQAWTQHTAPLQAGVAAAGPARAVTYSQKRTSHTFHLIMTICTAGLWGLFVWLPLTIWHHVGPRAKQVTRYQ